VALDPPVEMEASEVLVGLETQEHLELVYQELEELTTAKLELALRHHHPLRTALLSAPSQEVTLEFTQARYIHRSLKDLVQVPSRDLSPQVIPHSDLLYATLLGTAAIGSFAIFYKTIICMLWLEPIISAGMLASQIPDNIAIQRQLRRAMHLTPIL